MTHQEAARDMASVQLQINNKEDRHAFAVTARRIFNVDT